MDFIISVVVPVVLVVLLLKLIALPLKLFWKVAINSLGGFVCLWLLNSIAGITGLLFPINLATVLIAGFLGLPGIALLAFAQLFL